MLGFKQFLAEEDTDKLKHLEHVEDRVIQSGHKGYVAAAHALWGVHDKLTNKNLKRAGVTIKKDGAPSIVFGHHPENGKFFVASKSAFNKTPKINHTPEDIQRNHGHAPGLVEKLTTALQHLPKITPKTGIFQGDYMHDQKMISDTGTHYAFKPNTITYKAHKNASVGQKVGMAKMGIAIHTSYSGNSIADLKMDAKPNLDGFKDHHDVHVINIAHDTPNTPYPNKLRANFVNHMKKAHELAHSNGMNDFHNDMSPVAHHAAIYINDTVKKGTTPTGSGFSEFIKNRNATVKSAKIPTNHIEHIENHKQYLNHVFKLHQHLQKAKDNLVAAMDHHNEFEHEIEGKKASPEGYVIRSKGAMHKFVNRAGFSAANFKPKNFG